MMPVPPVIPVRSAIQRTAAGHGDVVGIAGVKQRAVVAAGAVLPKSAASCTVGTALQTVQEVNLDTRVLEYLIAIVEEHSLSKAADRFLLAQPALSRHLHNVEAMVGMSLFSREHNRLHPTRAGIVFANDARNILRMEKELFARLRSCDPGSAPQ